MKIRWCLECDCIKEIKEVNFKMFMATLSLVFQSVYRSQLGLATQLPMGYLVGYIYYNCGIGHVM